MGALSAAKVANFFEECFIYVSFFAYLCLAMENIRFTVGHAQRLILFFCMAFIGLLFASVLVYFIGDSSTPRVRISAVVQDMIAFAIPAIAVAVIVTRRPADLLMIKRPSVRVALLVIAALIACIPLLNALVEWNASLPIPENVFNNTGAQKEIVNRMFGGSGPGSLIAAILVIEMMAPISEELLFRGCLQRLIASMTGTHVAVWLSAIIFSLAHFDLSGFVPRMLLGIIFGYGMIWSGSLWTAVACHAVNNCLAVVAMWLEMRGDVVGAEMQTVGSSSPLLCAASAFFFMLLLRLAYLRRVSQTSCD